MPKHSSTLFRQRGGFLYACFFSPICFYAPHRSKAMVVNFTFLELDTHSDFGWWTLAIARADLIRKVEGGWSRMLRDLLRMSLGGPSGMQTAGVPLIIEDKLAVVFAKLAYVLSDGDGLRQALQWNGANGVKPCFKHWNVVKKGHPMAEQGSYVDICCSSPAKFQGFTEARFGKHSDSGKIDCSILRFLFLSGTPKKGSSKARCNAESEIDLSSGGQVRRCTQGVGCWRDDEDEEDGHAEVPGLPSHPCRLTGRRRVAAARSVSGRVPLRLGAHLPRGQFRTSGDVGID